VLVHKLLAGRLAAAAYQRAMAEVAAADSGRRDQVVVRREWVP